MTTHGYLYVNPWLKFEGSFGTKIFSRAKLSKNTQSSKLFQPSKYKNNYGAVKVSDGVKICNGITIFDDVKYLTACKAGEPSVLKRALAFCIQPGLPGLPSG